LNSVNQLHRFRPGEDEKALSRKERKGSLGLSVLAALNRYWFVIGHSHKA
jgi:hypothetical protein